LKFHDLYYEFDPATSYLYVMSVDEWQRRASGKLTQAKYVLQHAATTAPEPVVAWLLSSAGRMIAAAASRQIYVWDTPDNLAIIEETVTALDVPLQSREFRFEYADFADVTAALTGMLSPVGSLLPDSRTNTIIAWDQPGVLDRMGEALVALN